MPLAPSPAAKVSSPRADAGGRQDDSDAVEEAPLLPEAVTAPALQHAAPSGTFFPKPPPLERAGPTQAFKALNLQRSAPSGTFSKQFQLRVQGFVRD